MSGRALGWRLAVTVGLMALVLSRVDLRDAAATLRGADPIVVSAALLVSFGDRVFMIGKWFPLLKVQVPDVSFWRAARTYLASGFAGLLLPVSVGADALRAAGLGRERRRIVEVGASIVLERLLGVLASAAVCAVCVAALGGSTGVFGGWLPWIAAGAGVGVACLALPLAARGLLARGALASTPGMRRLLPFAGRFVAAWALYRGRPGLLLGVGALSVAEQLMPILIVAVLDVGLSTGVGLERIAVAVPLAMLFARLPISFAGIGVAEGALVYLLGLLGVAASDAFALSIAGTAVNIVVTIPGALLCADLAGAAPERAS